MTGKKIEENDLTAPLNVFYSKKVKIYPAYVSKHYSNCEKLVILLIILKYSFNGEGWHYLAVKNSVIALFRRATCKYYGGFCCLNCLHWFATEKKRESYKNVCENKDFCTNLMPFEYTKIL